LAIEGKNPRFKDYIIPMREKIAFILGLTISQVGLTTTTGDGLTDFGCGDGLQCLCILSTMENQ